MLYEEAGTVAKEDVREAFVRILAGEAQAPEFVIVAGFAAGECSEPVDSTALPQVEGRGRVLSRLTQGIDGPWNCPVRIDCVRNTDILAALVPC